MVAQGCTLHLVLRLRGGGWAPPDMGIAAGGLIKQTIWRDNYDPATWDVAHSTVFNVQIMNSATFQSMTGEAAPETPITAETYAAHGYPYYSIWNEKPSGIK